MAPLGRLVGKVGEEARALGLAEACRAHELVARAGRSCLLVRIDETQHGGGRAGKAQLVGKHVTDQPRALPRCPALGKRAHGKMANIKRIGEAHPDLGVAGAVAAHLARSEEHTSELQSLMRISYAVFCLKKKKQKEHNTSKHIQQILYR